MDAPYNWLIYEACGGHGVSVAPAPFDVRGCIAELLAVPQPMFYDWSEGGLERARRAMAEIDAKIEQQKKAYGKLILEATTGDPELYRAWRNGTWLP